MDEMFFFQSAGVDIETLCGSLDLDDTPAINWPVEYLDGGNTPAPSRQFPRNGHRPWLGKNRPQRMCEPVSVRQASHPSHSCFRDPRNHSTAALSAKYGGWQRMNFPMAVI